MQDGFDVIVEGEDGGVGKVCKVIEEDGEWGESGGRLVLAKVVVVEGGQERRSFAEKVFVLGVSFHGRGLVDGELGPGAGGEEVGLAGAAGGGGKGRLLLAEAEGVVGHVEDPAVGVDKAGVSEFCKDIGRAELLVFVSIRFGELLYGIDRFQYVYHFSIS